jgi:hypothetical protein
MMISGASSLPDLGHAYAGVDILRPDLGNSSINWILPSSRNTSDSCRKCFNKLLFLARTSAVSLLAMGIPLNRRESLELMFSILFNTTIEEILREFKPHLISIVFFMGPLKIAKNIK